MIIRGKDFYKHRRGKWKSFFQVLEKSYRKTSVCLTNKDPFKREQVDTLEITIKGNKYLGLSRVEWELESAGLSFFSAPSLTLRLGACFFTFPSQFLICKMEITIAPLSKWLFGALRCINCHEALRAGPAHSQCSINISPACHVFIFVSNQRITGVWYTDMMGPDLQVTPKYSLCIRKQVWICVCVRERRMGCRRENRKI